MRHIKSFTEINESSKAELNLKIRELKDKWKETDIKMDEIKGKVRDEKDGKKQELLVLTLQKLAAKQEMLELDIKVNKLKRKMLWNI